ncbi:MAG: putative HD phosphohydrolase [Candidatus Azotimanducaceae bacterium]|jgi:predicted HD phosphohydrolase
MFTRMDQGTKADWDHIGQEHMPHIKDMPNRIYGMLESLEGVSLGFATDQLHHALQTATMARRAEAADEMVLLSLLHDIGKNISVIGHGPICAEIIKAYVSDDAYHIIRTHQDFQGEHYYHYQGKERDLRLQFKDEPWYDKAVQFTDEWDQAAFDPAYEVDSLESFKPLIDQFFSVPGKMAKAA